MNTATLAVLVACLAAQEKKPSLPEGAIVRMGSADAKSSGYRGLVEGISFSRDGKTIATAGDKVRLWDVASGRELQAVEASGQHGVLSVALSPDGKTLAIGEMSRGSIRLWDVASGTDLRPLEIPRDDPSASFQTVGRLAFSADGKSLVSILLDQKVVLWDVSRRSVIQEFLHDGVRSVSFSADFRRLATSGYKDKSVLVWDVAARRALYQLDGEGESALSPDGHWLAYSGVDRKPWLWEVDRTKEPRPLAWKGKFVGSLEFSPDGKTLAVSGDSKIQLFHTATRETVQEHGAETYRVLAFSPDGSTLAYGKFLGVGLLPLAGGKARELTVIQSGRHQSTVSAVAFSPDGETLASASHDATVRLWEASTGKERALLQGHSYWMNHLLYSPDGTVLATAGQDDTVRLWDPRTGKETRKWKGGDQWPERIAFSGDGKTITGVGGYGKVNRWDLSTGEVKRLRSGSGHPQRGALSPDGRRVALGETQFGDRPARFRILDVESGEEILSLSGTGHFYPSGIAFSPDGTLVAHGCGDRVEIVDVAAKAVKGALGGHAHWPTNSVLSFSPDGKLLATAGDDKIVLLHDVATLKEVRRFAGHQGAVTSLAWSSDGRRLASGSADTTILVWDVAGALK